MFDRPAATSKDSLLLIDSTIVKAHRAAAGDLLLTGGEVNDSQMAATVLEIPHAPLVSADRAYDSEAIRQNVRDASARPVIPSRSTAIKPAWCSRAIHKRRHKVENSFCAIEDHRRIATSNDKLAANYLSAVALVSCRSWIKF
jgi:transposase